MANGTLRKFGYPEGLIDETEHWAVLLRPQQSTLGALVLGAKSPATAFGELPATAFTEMHDVVQRIERTLGNVFHYQRINYLMLMMVDPHVHFHVLPRYAEPQRFAGETFQDFGWPGPPRLDQVNVTAPDIFATLQESIKSAWRSL